MKEGIDKHVRRAVIEYKNCDGSTDKFPKDYKKSERPIHNRCVIIPAGYRNKEVEDDIYYDYETKTE